MARDSLRISAAQRQRLRNLLRRARETSGGIWHRNRDLRGRMVRGRIVSSEWRMGKLPFATRHSLFATRVSIAVLGVLADMLDRHHMLVLGGVEHDDALGRAAGDPDALDRTADQLALFGPPHNIFSFLSTPPRPHTPPA